LKKNYTDFELIKALESHKIGLVARRDRLNTLLQIKPYNYEELYEGMPQPITWRNDAIKKWGESTLRKSIA
jgi:hypothetical protein